MNSTENIEEGYRNSNSITLNNIIYANHVLISVPVCSNCQDPPLSALTQLNLNNFVTPSTDRGKSAEGNTMS